MIKAAGTAKQSQTVFKSPQGRQKILEFYDEILSLFDFAHTKHTVDTAYGETYLLEAGNKNLPALFLFHGSASNSSMWFADIAVLSPNFHVFAVDIIGDAGHSAQNRLDMKSDDYAMWINALLIKTNTEKAVLMGNSMGAWMCLKFASVFPEKVDKLVLIAAAGIAPIRISFVFQLILFGLRGKNGSDVIMKMVFGEDEIPEGVLKYTHLIAANYAPYTGEIPVLSDKQLNRLKMPVLYIAGGNDRLTNVKKSSKRLKKLLPQAKILVMEDSGHVIGNTAKAVMPFLHNAEVEL